MPARPSSFPFQVSGGCANGRQGAAAVVVVVAAVGDAGQGLLMEHFLKGRRAVD